MNDAAFQAYVARKSRGWKAGTCQGSCKDAEICQLRASESQFNCVVPKPGLQFGKRDVGSGSADGNVDETPVAGYPGANPDECHSSVIAGLLKGLVGSGAS